MAGREYPDIQVKESNEEVASDEAPFLPVQESVWKKSFNALRDHGVHTALEHIANSEDEAPWAGKVVSCCLLLYQVIWTAPGNFYSHLQLPASDVLDIYSKVPFWSGALVRVIRWHPTSPHLAVGTRDRVEIHHFSTEKRGTCIVLRDRQQQNITDLQWAPHCSDILAVAAGEHIVVWSVDPDVLSQSRLMPTSSRVESSPGHSPITSLSWCPHHLRLITCSPCDTRMKLWDVSLGLHADLERYKGGGVTMVKWSPDGSRVFAATPSPMFRVWETSMWTCEQWNNLARPCSAAVWDPKGETLLFALRDEPSIYCITFPQSGSVSTSNAVRCMDFSSPSLLPSGGKAEFAGTVKDLVWNHCGTTLAAIFDDCSVVAILHTKLWPAPELSVSDVIKGPPGSHPLVIDFQPFTSSSPVISIGWSNGVITTEAI